MDESKLIFDNTEIDTLSQRQIKFNHYLGLAEYEDMTFLIHCLKNDILLIVVLTWVYTQY